MKNNFIAIFALIISSCSSLPKKITDSECIFPTDNTFPGGLINYSLDSIKSDVEENLKLGDLIFATCKSDSQLMVLAPIPLSYKENKVQVTVSTKVVASIPLQNKAYRESRIEIQNKSLVNPPEVMQDRIKEEYIQGQKAKNTLTRRGSKQVMMNKPLAGIISSEFGVRRFINNQPRNRHIGLDIAATEGTPVKVPLKGEVILEGNFFYKGNVIYLDHGDGLVSSYSHLKSKTVTLGQEVSEGDILGYVGSTGRVTGPHLHWEVFYLGIPINPEIFLKELY